MTTRHWTDEELAEQTIGALRAPRTCNCCRYRNSDINADPCHKCMSGSQRPLWEWAGWSERNWWNYTFPKQR